MIGLIDFDGIVMPLHNTVTYFFGCSALHSNVKRLKAWHVTDKSKKQALALRVLNAAVESRCGAAEDESTPHQKIKRFELCYHH